MVPVSTGADSGACASSAALYPGTFDPPTFGHLDVVHRAARLFDRVVVAVGDNGRKSALFTVQERVELLRRHVAELPGVSVTSFRGLVVDFARAEGLGVLVRGLRTVSDFEYEYQMALTNRALAPRVDTVFVMPSAEYAFLSSSLIKEVLRHGGDASRWLPEDVADAVAKRLSDG